MAIERSRVVAGVVGLGCVFIWFSGAEPLYLGGGLALLVRAWRGPLNFMRGLATLLGGAVVASAAVFVWLGLRALIAGNLGTPGAGEAIVALVVGLLGVYLMWRGFKPAATLPPAQAREASAHEALRSANKLEARSRFDEARAGYARVIEEFGDTAAAADARRALDAIDKSVQGP